MTRPVSLTTNPTEIVRAFRLFAEPGAVFELRALDVARGRFNAKTCSGYFDDVEAAAREAVKLGESCGSIYLTINPPHPALLARAKNRIVDNPKATTSDKDILRRRWLYLDLDPVRPSGIPSSDEEHNAALTLARDIVRVLGWTPPLMIDTGNGAALDYRIDLPNDDASLALVRAVLAEIDRRFSTDQVTVDVSVSNAARIVRLPGTINRKGDGSDERPHRPACLLSGEAAEVVPVEALRALLPASPEKPTTTTAKPKSGKWDIADWVAKHIPDAVGPKKWSRGPRLWTIPVCPWNPDHMRGEAWVGETADGKAAAGCKHDGCSGKSWRDLREHYEPGATRRPRPVKPGETLPASEEWRAGLAYRQTEDGGQVIDRTAGNLALLLQHLPEWGQIAMDELWHRAHWRASPPGVDGFAAPRPGPLSDEDLVYVQHWFRLRYGWTWKPDAVAAAVQMAANQQRYHPVVDYLEGLEWDGRPRVDAWLRDYCSVEAKSPIGRWWLISAVARAYRPGCQVDHMLILEGPQRSGKSSTLGILGGQWYTDGLGTIKGKDSAQSLYGSWIVEVGELDAFRGRDATEIKKFLTMRVDHFRPSYGRFIVERKRTCVFAGSTNDLQYLQDATGARRFWPARCGHIFRDELERDRDQIWAEAAALYHDGERWWPTTEEEYAPLAEAAEERYSVHPWEPIIAEKVAASTIGEWTTEELLRGPLGVETARLTIADSMAVAKILRRLGFARKRKRGTTGRGYIFVRGEDGGDR